MHRLIYLLIFCICSLSVLANANDISFFDQHNMPQSDYGSIHGYVTDHQSHIPIAGIIVSIDSISDTTSGSGHYRLNNIYAYDRHDICFRDTMYADSCIRDISILPDTLLRLDVELSIQVGIEYIGGCDMPMEAFRVCTQGDYAFVTAQSGGLYIVNISSPESPEIVGHYTHPDYLIRDSAVRGNYAYLGGGTIHVLNISNPEHPVLVGEDLLNGYGKGIYVRGRYAYIGSGNESGGYFYIYDISLPEDPQITGSLIYNNSQHDFRYLTLQGDYAYVIDAGRGFAVININDPTSPELVAQCSYASANDIFVRGNYAYVSSNTVSLAIFDVSEPTSPYFIGSLNTIYGSSGIAVQGDYAFLAGGAFQIADISDPSHPRRFREFETSCHPNGLTIDNDYIYVADGMCLTILRFMGMPNGAIEGRVSNSNSEPVTNAIVKLDNSLDTALTDWNGHYLLAKVHTGPCSLTFISSQFPLSGTAGIIVEQNDTTRFDYRPRSSGTITGNITDSAYYPIPNVQVNIDGREDGTLSDNHGIFVLSNLESNYYSLILSHPAYHDSLIQNVNVVNAETTHLNIVLRATTEVSFVGQLSISRNAYGIAKQGNYLYLASDYSGMRIIDISDPSSPAVCSQIYSCGRAWEVCPRGDYAYVACGPCGVNIYNIENPYHPLLVGAYHQNAALSIDVQGNYAYILEGEYYEDGSVYILNIDSPAQPAFVSSYFLQCDLGNRRHVRVSGDYAYFGQSDIFYILNISNPLNPHLQTSIPSYMGEEEGLYISGNYAYATEYDRNLFCIIDISNPSSPIYAGVYYDFGDVFPSGVFAQDGFSYVANYTEGIKIFETADHMHFPILAGSYNFGGDVFTICASGDYIYTANDTLLEILRFQGNGGLSGNVTHDSIPVPGVLVSVQGWGQIDTAGIDGSFAFANVHPGRRVLSFSHQQFSDTSLTIDVLSGNITYVNMRLGLATVIGSGSSQVPISFSLSQSYPNPFNAQTTIKYSLPKSSDVSIDIFDILGRKVETLVSEKQSAGEHSVIWDAKDVTSGVYFYKIKAGEFSETKRSLLLK